MKNIFLVIFFFVLLFLLIVSDKHGTKVYDCRDAHWMPDIPIEVKRECSKMRKEEWERLHREGEKKLIST